MSRYYVQPRDRIFVRGYGFFSFAKNMDKKIAKNISKSFSGKYIQKYLDLVKQSATDAFKTASKRAIQKISEATGDIFGNKIANKIAQVSKTRNKIIQRHLKMRMIKKYLKEDIYLKKKGKKLLMN